MNEIITNNIYSTTTTEETETELQFVKYKPYVYWNGEFIRVKPILRYNDTTNKMRGCICNTVEAISAGLITIDGDYFSTVDGLIFMTND